MSRVRARSVSLPIASVSSRTESNLSCPRMRATKSGATCSPYRSAAVRGQTPRLWGASGEGGVRAHRRRGLVALTGDDGAGHRSVPEHGEPGGINAVGRDHRVHRRRHISGGKAQFNAAPVASDDDALNPVRAAQRFGGRHHVTGIDTGPDIRGREGNRLVAVVLGQE